MRDYRQSIYDLREAMKNASYYCSIQGKHYHGYNESGCVYDMYIPYMPMCGKVFLFAMNLYDIHDNNIGTISMDWNGRIVDKGIITISYDKFVDKCEEFAKKLNKER